MLHNFYTLSDYSQSKVSLQDPSQFFWQYARPSDLHREQLSINPSNVLFGFEH